MSDKIKDRISKLLNMTVKNGCTEDEQETALRMAASMAAQIGIELDSLRPKDAPKRKAKSKSINQEYKPHQALAAQAAAVLMGVECHAYNLGAHGLLFVGREELIEATEELMFWLFRQVEELYKQALPRGLSVSDRAQFRRTFKAACAERTLQRAHRAMRDIRETGAMQQATGHNALVVAGHFDLLRSEVREYWAEIDREADEQVKRVEARRQQRIAQMTEEQRVAYFKEEERERKANERRWAKSKGPRPGRSIPRGSGTRAGWEAGERVQLRKEVK